MLSPISELSLSTGTHAVLLERCLNSVLENLAELNGDTGWWTMPPLMIALRCCAAAFPEVHLIANQDNRGFAAANNQAARQATGRYLLLLNPDTEVPVNSLAPLIAYMDSNSDIGGPAQIAQS